MAWSLTSLSYLSFSFFFFKQKTAYEIGLGIPAEPLFRSCFSCLSPSRRRFLNEWEAFKKVISRRNIRRRITIPLTLSNLKLLRRITRTENILRSEERRVGKEDRSRWTTCNKQKNKK